MIEVENEMIRYAEESDYAALLEHDRHISGQELRNSIRDRRVLVMYQEDMFVGWLRFGLFWDNLPFMNLLYILEPYRGRGNGKRLTDYWEQEMAERGYPYVLTSTQSDEQAQFCYRKTGYRECGALVLPGEPLEMILMKDLSRGG